MKKLGPPKLFVALLGLCYLKCTGEKLPFSLLETNKPEFNTAASAHLGVSNAASGGMPLTRSDRSIPHLPRAPGRLCPFISLPRAFLAPLLVQKAPGLAQR